MADLGKGEESEAIRVDGIWRPMTREEASGRAESRDDDDHKHLFAGTLGDDEWDALQKLREEVMEDVEAVDWGLSHYSDVWFVRFLRAREFDVEAAAEMVRANIQWRSEFFAEWDCDPKRFTDEWGATEIAQRLAAFWPTVTHGEDVSSVGHMLINYERIGTVDIKSVFSRVKGEDVILWHCYLMELFEQRRNARMEELNLFLDWEVQSLMVEDLTGVGMKHMYWPGLGVLQQIAAIDDNHYVECLRNMYICNLPAVFNVFWRVVKPWAHPRTIAKFKFFKSNEKKELIEAIMGHVSDVSEIPEFIGAEGGCDKCSPCINAAGTWKLSDGAASNVFCERTLQVAAGYEEEQRVPVKEAGTRVTWQVTVESRDIDFSVTFYADSSARDNGTSSSENSADGESGEVVMEKVRLTSEEPSGSFAVAEEPGEYVFRLDNTYSMMRGKEASIFITVDPPKTTAAKKKKGLTKLRSSFSGKKKGSKGGKRKK